MKARATIKDVARLARVSVGTVSRVAQWQSGGDGAEPSCGLRRDPETGVQAKFRRALPGRTDRAGPPWHYASARCAAAQRRSAMSASIIPSSQTRCRRQAAVFSPGSFTARSAASAPCGDYASRLGGDFPVAVSLISSLGDDPESDWALAQLLEWRPRCRGGRACYRRPLMHECHYRQKGGRRTILNEPLSLPVPRYSRLHDRSRCQGGRHCLHLEGFRVGRSMN